MAVSRVRGTRRHHRRHPRPARCEQGTRAAHGDAVNGPERWRDADVAPTVRRDSCGPSADWTRSLGVFAQARRGGADEPACRPDPVRPSPPERRRPVRPSISGAPLPAPSCSAHPRTPAGQPSIVRAGRSPPELHGAPPSWPCSGWGLPAAPVTRGAGGLLHHRFTLTRTARPRRTVLAAGGLISVALSRRSPWVGVAHHLALVESGPSSTGT